MYTRETELRRLRSNDVNRLAEILGFDGGRRLMEIIPKYSNNLPGASADISTWNGLHQSTDAAELKYKPEHIRLIEDAARQNSGCYFAEILIDEWGTSGRKHERPTVGLLLQLLVEADLWRAVEFVAEEFLNEPPPERPLEGPAARIDTALPSEIFQSVAEIANDSTNYPDTEALNDNANCQLDSLAANNRDYYTKYHRMDKELNSTPTPPPRVQRGRLKQLQQQLQQQTTDNAASTAEARDKSNSNVNHQQPPPQQLQPQQSRPQPQTNTCDSNNMTTQNIPMLSALMADNSSSQPVLAHNESASLDTAPETPMIPMLTILADSANSISMTQAATGSAAVVGAAAPSTSTAMGGNLPLITELNLNGDESGQPERSLLDAVSLAATSPQPQSEDSRCSSLSNDSIDDEVDVGCANRDGNIDAAENEHDDDLATVSSEGKYLPNLSIFGRQSPNNDSSLTTVTGTSGENSFELSMNDSSSASNEHVEQKK